MSDAEVKRFHRITADVTPETAQALKVYCATTGKRMKTVVADAITDFVARGAKPAGRAKKA